MVEKIDIDAPWGKYRDMDVVGFIKQLIDQLKFFQKQNDTEKVRQDILGYNMILKSADPAHNAKAFLETKNNFRINGEYKRNLEIIEILKREGKWKV